LHDETLASSPMANSDEAILNAREILRKWSSDRLFDQIAALPPIPALPEDAAVNGPAVAEHSNGPTTGWNQPATANQQAPSQDPGSDTGLIASENAAEDSLPPEDDHQAEDSLQADESASELSGAEDSAGNSLEVDDLQSEDSAGPNVAGPDVQAYDSSLNDETTEDQTVEDAVSEEAVSEDLRLSEAKADESIADDPVAGSINAEDLAAESNQVADASAGPAPEAQDDALLEDTAGLDEATGTDIETQEVPSGQDLEARETAQESGVEDPTLSSSDAISGETEKTPRSEDLAEANNEDESAAASESKMSASDEHTGAADEGEDLISASSPGDADLEQSGETESDSASSEPTPTLHSVDPPALHEEISADSANHDTETAETVKTAGGRPVRRPNKHRRKPLPRPVVRRRLLKPSRSVTPADLSEESVDVKPKYRLDKPGDKKAQASDADLSQADGSAAAAGPRHRIDGPQSVADVSQTGTKRGRTHANSKHRFIDERHEAAGMQGPHFHVTTPRRSNLTSVTGQFLAYIGVLGLTVGTAIVIYGHFGGYSEYTPTGWLVTTVAQMLLFLGVINLVSGGIEQNNDDVSQRINSLSEQMMRMQEVTRDVLRGPKIAAHRYDSTSEQQQDHSSERAVVMAEKSDSSPST
jgi:hypothetical protein